jgi:hypothetical protein
VNSNDLIAGGRQVGIVFLCVMLLFGTLLLLWVPRLAQPVIFKVKQTFFVPAKGTISRITVYENSAFLQRLHGGHTPKMPSSAYYVRVWADYEYTGKQYTVDVKKYKGQYGSFREAYEEARKIAPYQEIRFESYYKKQYLPEDALFFKQLKPPAQSGRQATISFKTNPRNPHETSLMDQDVPIPQVGILIGLLLMFIIPYGAAWFFLYHFGKWRVLSSVLVLLAICINIVLCAIIKKHQLPEDYRLSRKPYFSVLVGPNYTYDQIKPFIEAE